MPDWAARAAARAAAAGRGCDWTSSGRKTSFLADLDVRAGSASFGVVCAGVPFGPPPAPLSGLGPPPEDDDRRRCRGRAESGLGPVLDGCDEPACEPLLLPPLLVEPASEDDAWAGSEPKAEAEMGRDMASEGGRERVRGREVRAVAGLRLAGRESEGEGVSGGVRRKPVWGKAAQTASSPLSLVSFSLLARSHSPARPPSTIFPRPAPLAARPTRHTSAANPPSRPPNASSEHSSSIHTPAPTRPPGPLPSRARTRISLACPPPSPPSPPPHL